jgi:hypothetical protein
VVVVQKDVLGLEVAVDDVALMAVRDGLRNLPEDLTSFMFL